MYMVYVCAGEGAGSGRVLALADRGDGWQAHAIGRVDGAFARLVPNERLPQGVFSPVSPLSLVAAAGPRNFQTRRVLLDDQDNDDDDGEYDGEPDADYDNYGLYSTTATNTASTTTVTTTVTSIATLHPYAAIPRRRGRPRAQPRCPFSKMSSSPRTARAQAPRSVTMPRPPHRPSLAGRSRGRVKRSRPRRFRSWSTSAPKR